MPTERDERILVDVDDSRLSKMTAAASIAGDMISTMNKDVGVSGAPAVTSDDALRVFADESDRVFEERWEPPKG